MNYKLIGKPFTKHEMLDIAEEGKKLYAIDTTQNKVVEVHPIAVELDLKTGKPQFKFLEQDDFEEEELIFKSKRSASLYLARKGK